MNKILINRLLIIASLGLSIAEIIFVCLSIFIDKQDTTYLVVALSSVVLGGLFNIIRKLTSNENK